MDRRTMIKSGFLSLMALGLPTFAKTVELESRHNTVWARYNGQEYQLGWIEMPNFQRAVVDNGEAFVEVRFETNKREIARLVKAMK